MALIFRGCDNECEKRYNLKLHSLACKDVSLNYALSELLRSHLPSISFFIRLNTTHTHTRADAQTHRRSAATKEGEGEGEGEAEIEGTRPKYQKKNKSKNKLQEKHLKQENDEEKYGTSAGRGCARRSGITVRSSRGLLGTDGLRFLRC